jgi:hypothetical protein
MVLDLFIVDLFVFSCKFMEAFRLVYRMRAFSGRSLEHIAFEREKSIVVRDKLVFLLVLWQSISPELKLTSFESIPSGVGHWQSFQRLDCLF